MISRHVPETIPFPGFQGTLNGIPYRFLFRVRAVGRNDQWRVQPLFVAQPVRTVTVSAHDRVKPLHAKCA